MNLFIFHNIGKILLFLALLLFWQPVSAAAYLFQDSEPTPPPPVIYIVQQGDTLYSIAGLYDISVDLLAATNEIQDAALISVGQELIIPPKEKEPTIRVDHIIQPGESLHAISLRYQIPKLDLARDNYLLRDDILPIGSTLSINGEKAFTPLMGTTYSICPGETLLGLAVQHDTSPWLLAQANDLAISYHAPPYWRLWIPGIQEEYHDLPEPLAGISVKPILPEPGQTVVIQITTTVPVSITGTFIKNPLYFHNSQVAIVGINTMEPAGIKNISISAPYKCYFSSDFNQTITIMPADYISETITVSEEIAQVLSDNIVTQEQEMIDAIFELESPIRLWEGNFSLPVQAAISSSFGNRRTYNVPQSSPYHTGIDLGALAGTPIYAPATGIVVFHGPLTVRGNVIILDHGWGIMSGYWHLESSQVAVGDKVYKGQQIGTSGNTGLSTAAHLHWELRVGGIPVDGIQWINEFFP